MKKTFFGIIVLSILLAACADGAKPAASRTTAGMDVDAAIKIRYS